LDKRGPLNEAVTGVTNLVTDISKGTLRQDILDERTGRVVLSLTVPEKESAKVLQKLRQVASEIDTVFAVNIISRVGKDDSTAADKIASEIGIVPAANCKTNVGLGRPLSGL